MRRRILKTATYLSTLLCAVVLALWVRSYWADDNIYLGPIRGGGWLRFESGDGSAALIADTWGQEVVWTATRWRLPGVMYFKVRGAIRGHLIVDYWLPFVVTAVLPSIRLARAIRRRRQRRAGFCPECGYDLRASSDRCPECGTPVPARPTGVSTDGSRGGLHDGTAYDGCNAPPPERPVAT